ncbi:MAG: hypothetical protein WCK15_05105 [Pirellula sp.]
MSKISAARSIKFERSHSRLGFDDWIVHVVGSVLVAAIVLAIDFKANELGRAAT